MQQLVHCPRCLTSIAVADNPSLFSVACPACGTTVPIRPRARSAPVVAYAPGLAPNVELVMLPPPVPQGAFDGLGSGQQEEATAIKRTAEPSKHSGLGIASFLIALLVGGLDVIVVFITAVGLATTNRAPDATVNLIGGLMALGCLNCASVPLCIVGVGLGVVALIAHKGSNQLFSWIGLFGNGTVIACVVSLYVAGAVMEKVAHNQAAPAPKVQKSKKLKL